MTKEEHRRYWHAGRAFLYHPLDWEGHIGYREDKTKCGAACPRERGGYFQCTRKPVDKVEGHPLCKQHTKIARRPR